MLRNTEVAVRSFMMLRPRFVHPSSGGGTSAATAPSQAPGATVAPGSNAQSASASIVPVFDFYSGLPKKPSPFLQHTVTRFEKYLGECRQWIEELEQLLLSNYSGRNGSGFGSSLVDSLPKVMSNVHDFFVHVAAKVSRFYWIGLMKIHAFPIISCYFESKCMLREITCCSKDIKELSCKTIKILIYSYLMCHNHNGLPRCQLFVD